MTYPDQASGLTSSVLHSSLDSSVNFVTEGEFPGAIEARYVRRDMDEVIVYLSSQTGCAKACRFCHLTQSGQTKGIQVTLDDYLRQARQVLDHYRALTSGGQPPAQLCNFNFMSRGEVLANQEIISHGGEVLHQLSALATEAGLVPRFKLSSILPREMEGVRLSSLFGGYNPDLYYSLYSVDESWRRRWLPKALPAVQGLEMLACYAQDTRTIPVIHFALIRDENDRPEQMRAMAEQIRSVGLRADINLVRYNPFSSAQGRESSEETMRTCAELLASELPLARVQLVGRVGHDVKASCGMFVSGRGSRRESSEAVLPSTPSAFTGFALPMAQ